MIEAVEIHETRVELKYPVTTGIWFGMGLLLAPTILFLIFSIIMLISGWIATIFAT